MLIVYQKKILFLNNHLFPRFNEYANPLRYDENNYSVTHKSECTQE